MSRFREPSVPETCQEMEELVRDCSLTYLLSLDSGIPNSYLRREILSHMHKRHPYVDGSTWTCTWTGSILSIVKDSARFIPLLTWLNPYDFRNVPDLALRWSYHHQRWRWTLIEAGSTKGSPIMITVLLDTFFVDLSSSWWSLAVSPTHHAKLAC